MNKIIKLGILSLTLGINAVSCSDDFVEKQFYDEVKAAPLASINEMRSFIRGIYLSMEGESYYGRDFLAYAEIRSDEMYSTTNNNNYASVYNYNMLSSDNYALSTYMAIYGIITKANIVISTDLNIIKGSDFDRSTARFALGQAYGLRAIAFFDAFRLYGQKYIPNGTLGIVLPLKFAPRSLQGRATIAETEAQIESDFNKAIELMSTNSAYFGEEAKTEFSVTALRGMMSRYYLYKGDYVRVRQLTNDVLRVNKNVASLHSYQGTFQVADVIPPNSIFELSIGLRFAKVDDSYREQLNRRGSDNILVNKSVYSIYADNDIRKTMIFINRGKYYLSEDDHPGKYTNKNGGDNIKILRVEEILLNGVEAEINGGSTAKALEYYKLLLANRLNDIKDANGKVMESVAAQLAKITSVTMAMLKTERMKELLGEGLRQWDLRRWGDAIVRPTNAKKDLEFNAFPIPRSETDIKDTPVKGNPGYDNYKD